MTTEGWIFMVGFRVFDVGLLLVWLVWFLRRSDEGDDPPADEGGGGGEGPGRGPSGDGPGGGGAQVPGRGPYAPGQRVRDHRPAHERSPRRGGSPTGPRPLPARVRRPRHPVPARRARA